MSMVRSHALYYLYCTCYRRPIAMWIWMSR